MTSFVNLYHVPKDHGKCKFNEDAFRQATGYLTQTKPKDKPQDIFEYERIVSCYKSSNGVYMSCGTTMRADSLNLCCLFFPLWILPALIPANPSKVLRISNVTVAHFPGISAEPYARPYVNDENQNGRLEITGLHVLCNEGKSDEVTQHTEKILSEFNRIVIDEKIFNEKWQELISFIALDIRHESPHTMFGSCHGISCFYQPLSVAVSKYGLCGDRILIATLGYGYSTHPFLNDDLIAEIQDRVCCTFRGFKKMNNLFTHPWIVHEYAPQSTFIIAQTTDEHGIIVSGVTAEAIKWLTDFWQNPKIRKDFDNLIILIPYGGQYMEDEMIEITKATDEGIIIVCAAGDCRKEGGGDVVFPAALGTVISVGVAGTGPKGREVDVSVDFASRPATLPGIENPVRLPEDCGIAAARIAGLLSLLLARINDIFKSTEHSIIKDLIKGMHPKRKYMHTCVIRDLLVNEGSGMHDPQLGYGNGEDIITSLLTMEKSHLLQKLANVLIRNKKKAFTDGTNKLVKSKPISKSDRVTSYCNLDGSNITVGVIDNFCILKERVKERVTTFEDLGSLHGEQCAIIVKGICPESTILCVKSKGDLVNNMASAFKNCLDSSFEQCRHQIQIDIISCSLGCFAFNYDLCKAVNEAVRAGKIIVCAAGNEGPSHSNTIAYPGRQGNILVIGGRDKTYSRIGFSSVGREMDFLAEAKLSHESAGSIHGTSFAAPVVAGYIALLLQFIREKMADDTVSAWSKNPDTGEYEWRDDVEVFYAAHNVYAMRELLRLFVTKSQEHADKEGYGCLDFATLFPHYPVSQDSKNSKDLAAKAKTFVENEAKKKIQKTLQHFYKRDY